MNLDAELFLKLNAVFDGSVATFVFTLITQLGDGLVLALIIVPLMYVFSRARFKIHIIALVLSVAVSGLLVTVMKVAVNRPRPPEYFGSKGVEVHAPLGSPSDRSFPSGHTQTAFGAAAYLACVYPFLAPVFLVLAVLVGLSRIALGVHFPLDVLAGAIIGSAFSVIGFLVNRRRLRAFKERA